ncbi:hypothetical protein [Burkholderia alba]|nr:hypothetical protein [Burkholderia alba]
MKISHTIVNGNACPDLDHAAYIQTGAAIKGGSVHAGALIPLDYL